MDSRSRDVVFYSPSAAPLLVEDARDPAGGAENQVLMLARALGLRGHAVGIVAFGDAGTLREQVDGVDVIEQPRPTIRLPLLRTLAFYHDSFATLRANRAGVFVQRAAGIHTALVALVARVLGSRFVYASASVFDFDLRRSERRRWIVWSFALGVRLADAIVVQTDEQARLCRQRFHREPRVIRSIAEPAPAQHSRPEAFLWIGSLTALKRPLAFVDLARAVPEARFLMVPVPVPSAEGEQFAAALARAEKTVPNLELLVPRPRAQLAPLLERAVAIVSTSRSEGMPNVFLEAWSRGVPALALAHDPDGVLEREGLGACANDSPARLASLAGSLWETRADRQELAARCRDYVAREHALGPIVDRWAETLRL